MTKTSGDDKEEEDKRRDDRLTYVLATIALQGCRTQEHGVAGLATTCGVKFIVLPSSQSNAYLSTMSKERN